MFLLVIFSFFFVVNNCYQFNPSDVFTVYNLKVPLFKAKLGDLLKAYNAFHFGIGFHNQQSGEEYCADFIADPSVLGSIFPDLTPQGEVVWSDGAITRFRSGLNRSNWETVDEVYQINGTVMNRFLGFASEYNQTFRHYKLFDVMNNGTGAVEMMSFNCVDFMVEGIKFIKSCGARMIAQENFILIDYPWLIIDGNYVEMDYGKNKQEIYTFYEDFKILFNQTIHQATSFEELLQKSFYMLQKDSKNFIYHYEEKYYIIDITAPYVTYKYDKWMIP